MSVEFSPGSLVRARGRDWIVLPDRHASLLRLRPITSALADEIGIFLPLEGAQVASAQFAAPEPKSLGDATGVMALFNAARLNLRSGAAPFRSLGRISVTPRPYQFVPLIMALRLDPVRLLIADDVGVGKTIEAGMIARELLDRGIARRLGVVTPAHLWISGNASLLRSSGSTAFLFNHRKWRALSATCRARTCPSLPIIPTSWAASISLSRNARLGLASPP